MHTHPNDRQLIPWNRGKIVGQKLPLKLRDIFGLRVRLQLRRRTRDLALFNSAIDSKLRGCGLLVLKFLTSPRRVRRKSGMK